MLGLLEDEGFFVADEDLGMKVGIKAGLASFVAKSYVFAGKGANLVLGVGDD